MLNFAVGPVQMDEEIVKSAAQPVPYFRTQEFSSIILQNESLIGKFACIGIGYRTVFLTGSGTAAMEAAVINCFTPKDNVLVVNGGNFGQRFADICEIHGIPYIDLKLKYGEVLTEEHLKKYDNIDLSGFLINLHETSTGVLYDLELVSRFCKKKGVFLIVDAISSFLADEINVNNSGIDVLILGSQKALAVAPGISALVLSPKAIEKIQNGTIKSLYFNLKAALENGERGQTPYTPAVGILLQLNYRLKQIDTIGPEQVIAATKALAEDFRSRISKLPFSFFSSSMSNAATALVTNKISAYKIFEILKNDYGIWVCPNGGELKERVFRVGHMGALSIKDNHILVEALKEIILKA